MKDFYGGQWILTENLQEKNGINYLKLGRSDELDFLFVAIYAKKTKQKKKIFTFSSINRVDKRS